MKKELNVLLIEDNPGDAFLLEELLDEIPQLEFTITKCDTLKNAIGALQENDFDIILQDLGLPDSQGLSGLETILNLDGEVPVVIITGLNDIEVGSKAVELGAQSYMVKGEFSTQSIFQTIMYSIDRTKFLKKIRYREKELKIKNHQLEEANVAKELLISIISHDLRGPVNSIVNLLEITYENFEEIDDKTKKRYLKALLESASNTRDLMENLLGWAQIQSSKHKIEPSVVNANKLVKQNTEPLKQMATAKEIKITTNIPEELQIYADKKMIGTVIRNLLSNALKFTPRNGNISLEAEKLNNEAVFKIKDSGVGIKKEMLETLFTAEKKISNRGTENEPGSGFGLVLCKEFIEKNNGSISVKNNVGSGTLVTFTLPQPE